uniref:Putative secreted protein n=1 Tax=Anopheles darlingi TaxID=43151 RepID=A0A2M4DFJ9_ANODA
MLQGNFTFLSLLLLFANCTNASNSTMRNEGKQPTMSSTTNIKAPPDSECIRSSHQQEIGRKDFRCIVRASERKNVLQLLKTNTVRSDSKAACSVECVSPRGKVKESD